MTSAGQHVPTSTSTIWRILDQHQRILRPQAVAHEPRRITSKGSCQLGRHRYYVGTEYSGQLVAVTVRPAVKILDVLLYTPISLRLLII